MALLGSAPGQEPAWEALFDGRSLTGWTQRGGAARYGIEDGAIVGETVAGTPNSFLCTDRQLGDFELELEFLVDPGLNSGVQIRSLSDPGYRRGVVHGYQIEIDPSPRAWSGGLYDEARRGWLGDLAANEPARRAFRAGEWNRLRALCVGDRIRTWINGIAAADLVDAQTLAGFIGLQVHGVGRDATGRRVRWRAIRVRDLGRHAWEALFDGATLSGWRAGGGGAWTVRDGTLVGEIAAAEPRHGILLSERRLADATVRIVYRAVAGNSGLYFRCEPVAAGVGVHGMQAEIDPDRDAGMLYETGGRGRIVVPPADVVARAYRREGWNTMTVSAHGGRIAVHVNGVRTAELLDDPGRREGHLGVQLHGGQDVRIEVQAIELLAPVPKRDTASGR